MPSKIYACLDCGRLHDLPFPPTEEDDCIACGGRLHGRRKSGRSRQNAEIRRHGPGRVPGHDHNPRSSRARSQGWRGGINAHISDQPRFKPAPPRGQRQAAKWRLGNRSKAILFLGALYIALSMLMDPQRDRAPEIWAPTSTPVPTAQAIAPGIQWNNTGRPGVARLTIKTGDGQNYFIKLVDARTGLDAVALYAEGGRTLSVKVPLGLYVLRYASGKTWRGEAHAFGPGGRTRYVEGETLLDINRVPSGNAGWTLGLRSGVTGNLPVRRISPGSF